MEVKSQYKETEVGFIPEEWELRGLLTTVQIANGQVDPRVEPFRSMTLVAPDHIESGTGRLLEKRTAAEQRAISGKYRFDCGDIIYSKIRPYLRKAILADFSGLCSADMYPLKPAADVVGGFIHPVLLSHRFTKYADSVSVRSGMPKINRAELAEFVVALPQKTEQRAIAEALSGVDRLLSGLKRLIVKKRALKQAAMQQLLTGQTRLPSFHGEWETKVLGNIANISKGTQLHSSETNPDGHFPHFNGGMFPSSFTDKFNTPANTIVISEGGNSCGYVQLVQQPFWCGGHCYAIVPKNIVNQFLFHALKGQQTIIMGLRVGSGLPNVQKTALADFNIHIPRDPAEQIAIAATLTDMDADLATLEKKREKISDLKQAMMQELLTGRTRLV